jgi:starch-binding outer membrane protein, SusD/RagB family
MNSPLYYRNNCKIVKRIVFLILAIFTASIPVGCKKFVEADGPKTSLSQANVYNTNVAAISVLTGLYQQMSQDNFFSGDNSISLFAGLYSDELSLSSAVSQTDTKTFYYVDSLFSTPNGNKGTEYWSTFYKYVFACNSAIIGLNESDQLTPAIKDQLLGEAMFMRAFVYFYLVNFYGEVPIVTTNDWQANASLSRSSVSEVYQQIIRDLNNARELLSDIYLDGNLQPYTSVTERVRPTKWAAIGLLARAYLYNGDWANAEKQASILINYSTMFSILAPDNVFLKNSNECIWQMQPILSGRNTRDAELFLLPATGPSSAYPVYLSSQLLKSFESGDLRRYGKHWIDSVKVGTANPVTYYFPYKYKAGVNSSITSVSQLKEYTMLLRLGEQYLIRAEAEAMQGNIQGAIDDINFIRLKHGGLVVPLSIPANQAEALAVIIHERQVELFTELGNRWLDLKRYGIADAVMSVIRPLKAAGRPWKSYMQFFPILYSDILKDPSITQNLGY